MRALRVQPPVKAPRFSDLDGILSRELETLGEGFERIMSEEAAMSVERMKRAEIVEHFAIRLDREHAEQAWCFCNIQQCLNATALTFHGRCPK